MALNIFPVIVVYNKSIRDSLTLYRIKESGIPYGNITIVDNSTSYHGVKEYCEKIGYNYITMNGNAGLSKAYNKALDFLRLLAAPNDLVMWLDDDTDVTKEYISILCSEADRSLSIDVFMPVIIGQDGVIYSPNEGAFLKSRFISSVDEQIDMSKINGINSCLAVRYRIYAEYRYKEDLFLDMIDNQFFDDMRDRGISFQIIRTLIHQTFFQRGDNVNIGSVISRFKLRIADFMKYARRKGVCYLVLALAKSYGWGFVNGKKYKSISIFWTCVSQGTRFFLKNIV